MAAKRHPDPHIAEYIASGAYRKLKEREAEIAEKHVADRSSSGGRFLTEDVTIEVQDATGIWRPYEKGVPNTGQYVIRAMQAAARAGRSKRVRAVDSQGRVVDILTGTDEGAERRRLAPLHEMVHAARAGDHERFAELFQEQMAERVILRERVRAANACLRPRLLNDVGEE